MQQWRFEICCYKDMKHNFQFHHFVAAVTFKLICPASNTRLFLFRLQKFYSGSDRKVPLYSQTWSTAMKRVQRIMLSVKKKEKKWRWREECVNTSCNRRKTIHKDKDHLIHLHNTNLECGYLRRKICVRISFLF